MAFTSYVMQSVICTAIFFGWGFLRFGHFKRANPWLDTAAVCALRLAVGPWWLARFRFGPLEWLWRLLTYWKYQPMRLHPAV